MKKKLGSVDFVVEVPATTLSETNLKLTKVMKNSEADVGNLTVKPEVESLEGKEMRRGFAITAGY